MSKDKSKRYSGTDRMRGRVKFHFYRGGSAAFFWDKKQKVGSGVPIGLLDIAKAPVVSGAEYEITIDVRVRELPASKPKPERNPWNLREKC